MVAELTMMAGMNRESSKEARPPRAAHSRPAPTQTPSAPVQIPDPAGNEWFVFAANGEACAAVSSATTAIQGATS